MSRLQGEHDKAQNNEREYNILYPMFDLTIYFGLRREEVLGLRWSAIDFNNKALKINHTVTKGTTVNRLNATKTEASERQYPLRDNQINLLLELKSILAKQKRLFGNSYIENDYLFKNRDGKPFYPDYPSKVFKKLLRTMPDLPQQVSFHGLRKTCISMLVHAGADIKSIQNWVGHKDQETTLGIYAKVKDKSSKGEISDAMTNLLHI
jgi:integrase